MSENLYKGPDGSALRFFERAVKNQFQSEQHGRPIFDTGLFVEVITPGSNESVPEFQVQLALSPEAGGGVKKSAYYEKYSAQIEAFKASSGEFLQQGMPLSQWPQIAVGTVETLRAVGIHTVEQLAGVSDGNLMNLGTGGRTLREQAIQYLNAQQFGVPTAQAGAQLSAAQERIAQLEAENADLRAHLAARPAQTAAPAPEVPQEAAPVTAESLSAPSGAPQPILGTDALAGLSGAAAGLAVTTPSVI
jgi:hypothetical protein